ncbi:unnamed protein product [Soboliphyme baturini]|uniref:Inner membrane protein n=1 Tax=Soboliphyme baturini TaxID=241478 RepID=A0A183IC93_9BILA|nr:unnamed protein product [Soboliphyme baturini]
MDRQIVTQTILIRHPRSILACAIIQLCIGLQIVVFGIVCHFYDGCRYMSSLWMGTIFLTSAICGIVLIKSCPKRNWLIFYFCSTLLSLLLSIILFGITQLLQANQIMENTKLAMYTLHLLFIPGHVPMSLRSGTKLKMQLDPEYAKYLIKKKSKKTQTTARMRLLPDLDYSRSS